PELLLHGRGAQCQRYGQLSVLTPLPGITKPAPDIGRWLFRFWRFLEFCEMRRLYVVLHRYLGLLTAGFLALAGLTGSLL
ncbi:PepSY domain-containing protein, partial [Klebsiella pneumoniae]|nr:PepSY domain-containing protein [Klebsiella pneumoniae]